MSVLDEGVSLSRSSRSSYSILLGPLEVLFEVYWQPINQTTFSPSLLRLRHVELLCSPFSQSVLDLDPLCLVAVPDNGKGGPSYAPDIHIGIPETVTFYAPPSDLLDVFC
jgi:hypothetical protein